MSGRLENYRDEILMLKDLASGDESVAGLQKFLDLTPQELQALATFLAENRDVDPREMWRFLYVTRPPSPREFLTEEYLGPVASSESGAEGIYPHVRQNFIDFLDPNAHKRVLALSTCIGYGKSTLSVLIILYLVIQLSYMRNPKKFYGLNEAGSLVAVLMAFTLKKAKQLLLKPFKNILRASPIFVRTKTEDTLAKKQMEIGPQKIAYTSASDMEAAFQFARDIHILLISDRSNLLGLNVFAGVCSEIAFWAKRGIPLDEIWGSFQDLRNRINSRFHHRYLTATILDSSPLDLNLSPIDKWIYSGDAEKDPEVMLVNKKSWEIINPNISHPYPIWRDTKKTFPVFKGDATRPPKILAEEEIQQYTVDDVFNVPVDLKKAFEDDLQKSICDICAYPSGGDAKLLPVLSEIENSFSGQLRNVYSYIYAPANQNPSKLIWSQIVDQFFIRIGERYQFYRNPGAPRYIHCDLSEVKDSSGVAMVHMETNQKGESVVVVDFSISIAATKDRISLDAVSCFIDDLIVLGHLNITSVTADRYQSAFMIERFKRNGFNAFHLSVDRSMTPYKVIVSWLRTGRLKSGRNIILKNNWKSLVEVTSITGRKKIDHIQIKNVIREGPQDWESSLIGWGAKDLSDAVAGAAFTCIESEGGKATQGVWVDDQVESLDESNREYVNDREVSKTVAKALQNIYAQYGLKA